MKFNSFMFHRSYFESIKCLETDQQLHLYNAIFSYVFDKSIPELTKYEQSIFKLIKPNIDTSAKKYQIKVKNGKKGGAPKGNQNAKKYSQTTENNQKQPNDNLKTSKNNKEKEKEKEKELEKEYIKETNKENKKTIDSVLETIKDSDLKINLQEFIKSRKALNKPLTTHALELLIERLYSMANSTQEQIEIIKQSIIKGWANLYPIPTGQTQTAGKQAQGQTEYIKNNYTMEEINGLITDLDHVEV